MPLLIKLGLFRDGLRRFRIKKLAWYSDKFIYYFLIIRSSTELVLGNSVFLIIVPRKTNLNEFYIINLRRGAFAC